MSLDPNQSILAKISAGLNLLIIKQVYDRQFQLVGLPPDWLQVCFPEVVQEEGVILPADSFPFLETFIFDADQFWQANQQGTLTSGLWTEVSASEQEIPLQASAVLVDGHRILIIELAQLAYAETFSFLQAGREYQLNHLTECKQLEQQLRQSTFYDPLTGLPNRSFLRSAFRRLWSDLNEIYPIALLVW